MPGEKPLCANGHDKPTWKAENYHSKFAREDVCFTCAFWFEVLDEMDNDSTKKYFVVEENDGIGVYSFAVEYARVKPETTSFLGHSGGWFYIRTADGEVYTNNLWHRGTVSLHMKDKFLGRINVEEIRSLTRDEAAEQREKL